MGKEFSCSNIVGDVGVNRKSREGQNSLQPQKRQSTSPKPRTAVACWGSKELSSGREGDLAETSVISLINRVDLVI